MCGSPFVDQSQYYIRLARIYVKDHIDISISLVHSVRLHLLGSFREITRLYRVLTAAEHHVPW